MPRVLTGLDHLPALLPGRRTEVLARNAVLVAVLGHEMAPGTSFARYLFTEPAARARIANWPDIAAAAVGGLS